MGILIITLIVVIIDMLTVRLAKSKTPWWPQNESFISLHWRLKSPASIVYSTVDSDADERKHQSSTSLAFVRGIHRGPVNSPHKWPVTRKMFPFDGVIMSLSRCWWSFRIWSHGESGSWLNFDPSLMSRELVHEMLAMMRNILVF